MPDVEGTEYAVDKIFRHRARRSGLPFLVLIKGDPTYDAERPRQEISLKKMEPSTKRFSIIPRNIREFLEK